MKYIIYKLTTPIGEYIGNTTKTIKNRLATHKKSCMHDVRYNKHLVSSYNNDESHQWKIEEIDSISYVDGSDRKARILEQHHLDISRLDGNNLNLQDAAAELEGVEYIKQYGKKWRLDNVDNKREYDRLYYIKNKDAIRRRMLEYNRVNSVNNTK